MVKDVNGKKFYENAQGHLVPEELVKPVDQLRDDVVERIFGSIQELKQKMIETKKKAKEDVDEFLQISLERYGVKRPEDQRGITLTSYDGKHKICIEVQDRYDFTEGIDAAKQLINECIKSWSGGADQRLIAIVNRAFKVTDGHLDTKRILDLRTLNIPNDPKWEEAMKAINEALVVRSSAEYLRIYTRRDSDGKYDYMDLNFSKM